MNLYKKSFYIYICIKRNGVNIRITITFIKIIRNLFIWNFADASIVFFFLFFFLTDMTHQFKRSGEEVSQDRINIEN